MGLLMGGQIDAEKKFNSSSLGVSRSVNMESAPSNQLAVPQPGTSSGRNEEDSFDKISKMEDQAEEQAQIIVEKRLQEAEYNSGFQERLHKVMSRRFGKEAFDKHLSSMT